MSVCGSSTVLPGARAGVFAIRAVSSRAVLTAIVLLSVAVHWLISLGQAVPLYFPDEYIYASLARSLAQAGRPFIRGAPARLKDVALLCRGRDRLLLQTEL
jgi:hypothetical protein